MNISFVIKYFYQVRPANPLIVANSLFSSNQNEIKPLIEIANRQGLCEAFFFGFGLLAIKNSLFLFLIFALKIFSLLHLSKKRFESSIAKKSVVIFDIFWINRRSINDDFSDSYFGDFFQNSFFNMHFDWAVLPRIPFEISFLNVFRKHLLLRQSEKALNEINYFSFGSVFRFLHHQITYFFLILNVIPNIGRDKTLTLDQRLFFLKLLFVSLSVDANYCFYRKIVAENMVKSFSAAAVRVIVLGWLENQKVDVFFNLGFNLSKIKVNPQPPIQNYGCQFFIPPGDQVHLTDFESAIAFGYMPERVYVMGRIFQNGRFTRLGISPRYHCRRELCGGNVLLPIGIAMTYYPNQNEAISSIVLADDIRSRFDFIVREHPGATSDDLSGIFEASKCSEETVCAFFQRVSLLITAGSSLAAQALSLRIPVILVSEDDDCSVMNNVLLEKGRGVLWEIVNSPSELCSCISRLRENQSTPDGEHISEWYSSNYFNYDYDGFVRDLDE